MKALRGLLTLEREITAQRQLGSAFHIDACVLLIEPLACRLQGGGHLQALGRHIDMGGAGDLVTTQSMEFADGEKRGRKALLSHGLKRF